MKRVAFLMTSQTIPYVEMAVGCTNGIMIPAGKMLNVMESILRNKSRVMAKDGFEVSATYDSYGEMFYIEQRSDKMDHDVRRYECPYKLKTYIDLYISIIDVIQNLKWYYQEYKIFGITLNKSVEINKQSIMDGSAELYIGKSVNHVWNQFNEVHPYLLDNVEQCTVRTLKDKEIEDICKSKMEHFLSLI